MRKIYVLAVALLATCCMLAENTVFRIKPEYRHTTQAVMSAEGQAMFRAEQAYNQYVGDNNIDMPGYMKFSWTDPQGEKWDVSMHESGNWSENFPTVDYAAWYGKVFCTLSNQDCGANIKKICYAMWFPTYSLWNEKFWSELFPGEDAAKGKLLPLKYLVSTNQIMTTNWPRGWLVPNLSDEPDNFFIGSNIAAYVDDALIIMNSNTKSSEGGNYFDNGKFGYARYKGIACGPKAGSSFNITSFDEENSSIGLHFKGVCTNAKGEEVWAYDYEYSGYAFLSGVTRSPIEWTATNVHIVNTGSVNGEDDDYFNFDDKSWGPLQRFYVLACGEGYTYDEVAVEGGPYWTSTRIPKDPIRIGDNAILKDLRGALFSAKGTTEPNGIWYEAPVEVSIDESKTGHTNGVPTANSFLYGGWRNDYWPWTVTDGLQTIYRGVNFNAPAVKNPANGTYNPFVMNGTTEGFGFKGMTRAKCEYTVKFKGNIVYHYDPTDYLKTRNIPSVGAINVPAAWNGVSTVFAENGNNINVKAANGMIYVTVENAAMVNIYNMAGMVVKSVNAKAGQTVSVDVANGIYVVRVGGKTVKVAI